MTDLEVLRFVVSHMEQYRDPVIRSALTEKGVTLARIDQALSTARALAKQARETGKPIVLPDPPKQMPGFAKVILGLAGAAAAAAAAKLLVEFLKPYLQ